MGPYALALAYYGPHFDDGKPIEESWINRQDSQNFSQLVIYNTNYQQGAGRYEVGEHSNFILIPMLLKAIQQLNRWGVGNIQQYCSAISKNAILTLQETGFPIEEEDYRAGHLFGVRFRGDNSQKIKEGLEKSRINVSYRGDAIRVSPNVYNREEDLSRLVKVLLK
jgi:selenocysteine lyase/cysteine desulfurase